MKGIFSWKIVLIYSLLIVIFSAIPLKISGNFIFPFSDKLFHWLIYFFLSLEVTNISFINRNVRARLTGFFYAFFLGLLMEVMQLCLPFRRFEAGDILFNTIGSLMGCLIKIV